MGHLPVSSECDTTDVSEAPHLATRIGHPSEPKSKVGRVVVLKMRTLVLREISLRQWSLDV